MRVFIKGKYFFLLAVGENGAETQLKIDGKEVLSPGQCGNMWAVWWCINCSVNVYLKCLFRIPERPPRTKTAILPQDARPNPSQPNTQARGGAVQRQGSLRLREEDELLHAEEGAEANRP